MALQNVATSGAFYTEPAVASASASSISGAGGTIGNWLRKALDPYRPELHYMRGPGPKWREKHGLARHRG
jgi:hypothetical protein